MESEFNELTKDLISFYEYCNTELYRMLDQINTTPAKIIFCGMCCIPVRLFIIFRHKATNNN